VEFDRREGLLSIPTRFGVARAILISRVLHVATILALAAVGPARVARTGVWRRCGLVAVLLAWEQSLVRADDLSQVKRAFDMNGWVGVLYFVTTAVAVYWR
jgi:4-hydroxybenzoate polyprenyltransferase